ncbi:MAG: pilus assembly protein PilP [Polyangiaceae bacterium]|nr:pilus assembly protein PilP [Polyangiaceae bacterium]
MLLVASVFAVPAVVAGCDDEVTQAPPPPRGAAAVAVASASASASASAGRVFAEGDFTPSDRNRDPFRDYPELFTGDQGRGGGPGRGQQKIIAERFALDELKLVGIVTGGTQARAMFVDPERVGHIITVGQLVGRSELVKAGGVTGPEYDLNWKVERIREKDVVFVRDNPGRNVATATRVVALRPEGDLSDRK